MERSSNEIRKQQQFVLVHGFCHGGWCWYKLAAALNSKGGCRATAIDLPSVSSSSFSDYVRPLMEFLASLPDHEKVVLVGHSYGGMPISLAMETFPSKIALAVFLTAYMPSSSDPPASLIHEYFRRNSTESFMDSEFTIENDVLISAIFGPDYMAAKLYASCSAEDLELAKMLIRPSKFYLEDLSKKSVLSDEKYGSVKRCYIICEDDEVMQQEFQKYNIERSPPHEVITIPAAGHMPMLTQTHHLSSSLLQLSHKYCC